MGSIPERGRGADARLGGPHAEDLEPALESCVKQAQKHSVKPALTVSSRMQSCINQGGTAEPSVPLLG